MAERFGDEEGLVLFDLTQMELLPDKIKELIADEERLQQIAERGYQKTVQEHLWIHRVQQFLDMIG